MVRVLEVDDGNLLDVILAFIMEKDISHLLYENHKVGEAFTAVTHLLHEKLPWLTHLWEEIAGFLVDKLKDVLHSGSSVGEAFTAITHLLHEKLPWLTHLWEEIAGFLVDKLKDVLPSGSSVGEAFTAITHLLHEKLPWLTHLWEEIAGFLVDKLNVVLPPGYSYVIIRVLVPLAMVVVLPVTMRARPFWWMVTLFTRGSGRMMKAPGRAGMTIPRVLFEADPRSYFVGLRARVPVDRLLYKELAGLALALLAGVHGKA